MDGPRTGIFRGMGVAADLGYTHKPPNLFRRLVQRFGSTTVGAWLFSKTITPIDRLCRKLTRGRTSVPGLLAGLPVLFVTTRGRKTRRPRTSPLIAVPIGDDLALVGTNFGQPPTPGWALNLEADPAAHVAYRDAEVDVVARPATDHEWGTVWSAASSIYPGYPKYRQRITTRRVRMFILETSGQNQDP